MSYNSNIYKFGHEHNFPMSILVQHMTPVYSFYLDMWETTMFSIHHHHFILRIHTYSNNVSEYDFQNARVISSVEQRRFDVIVVSNEYHVSSAPAAWNAWQLACEVYLCHDHYSVHCSQLTAGSVTTLSATLALFTRSHQSSLMAAVHMFHHHDYTCVCWSSD